MGLQPLEGGVALIAMKSGAPIIPAYIQGSFQSMPPGARFVRPTRIKVTFGPAIVPAERTIGLSSKEGRLKLLEDVEEALKKLEETN